MKRVLLLALVCPLLGNAADLGQLKVAFQSSSPMLQWSNSLRQPCAIQTTSNLAASAWQSAAIITSDGADFAWADEGAPGQAVFYRVALATNPAPFLTLQSALERACANQGIVGASAAAFIPGQGRWLGTYGSSDGHSPIRPDTRFEFGSVTKTFTAAVVLRLAEEGKLGLEDTLAKWLPNLNRPNISSTVTVRQLLGHRSGVYNFGDDYPFRLALFSDWCRYWQPEEVLDYVIAPYFPPGTDGQYSNTGYVLLGMVVRNVSHSSMATEMRRTVFERAGLRSTVLCAEEKWPGELAHPHLDFDGDGVHEDLGDKCQTGILSSFWTSGALVSTPADVLQFTRALFEGGLLNTSSLNQMRTFLPVDIGGADYDYGLGLIRFTILGREHWAHSGGLFGEYGWFSYCPSTGVALAVAYNYPQTVATGAGLPGELLLALAQITGTPSGPAPQSASEPALPVFPFIDPRHPATF